jgi:presenilin 1
MHSQYSLVSITMILSACAVVFINNEETIQQGEASLQEAYIIWKGNESDSTGKTLIVSLGNAFVMVSAICAMTFVIVFLYKLKCMKLLIAYMVFASATLLGVLGGSLFEVAIDIYRIPIDFLTFYFFLYNFAVVGIISIFWAKGVPPFVTQGYLIATSVILAWQLAHFDTWTTWTLLVMLALYDLCAVLTPCGPLRALVNLMSEEDSPHMPGLLYEAELPAEIQRPGVPKTSQITRTHSDLASPKSLNKETKQEVLNDPIAINRSYSEDKDGDESNENCGVLDDPTIEIPLAIARVYNLPLVGVFDLSKGSDSGVSPVPLLAGDIPQEPSPAQLKSIVTVRMPRLGGRIERGRGNTYLERDRFGTPKRTLWLDKQGKVFAEEIDDDDAVDDPKSKNSIRLGLGDFIFYSVLVGKAAQYSFATFAACMLVILAGLGSTLILLAVYHHALPALPISIFLGVLFYILTRLVIEPWIEALMTQPFYV